MAAHPYPANEEDQQNQLKVVYNFDGSLERYYTWSFEVQSYLDGRGVVHHLFCNDAVDPPDVANGDGSVVARRLANRKAVCAYLNLCITGSAKTSIALPSYMNKPRAIWAHFAESCGHRSAPRLDALMTDFDTFHQRKNETIKDLQDRLSLLVLQISAQGEQISEIRKKRAILNAITDPDWFSAIRNIRKDSHANSFLWVCNELNDYEVEVKAMHDRAALLGTGKPAKVDPGLATAAAGSSSKSSNGGYSRHTQGERGKREKGNRRDDKGKKEVVCFHCGKKGHSVSDCRTKLSGTPQTPEGKKAWDSERS